MRAVTDRIIDRQERALGVELDYLRDVADSSLAAFGKFGLAGPLLQHRRHVAAAPWHLARLAATRVQDCGTCVQTVVNAARADGVPADLLRTALADALGTDTPEAVAAAFGRAVAARADDVTAAREAARRAFGEDGLVELSLAVATVQLFPILKRGLGQDVACRLVHVEI